MGANEPFDKGGDTAYPLGGVPGEIPRAQEEPSREFTRVSPWGILQGNPPCGILLRTPWGTPEDPKGSHKRSTMEIPRRDLTGNLQGIPHMGSPQENPPRGFP